MEWLNEPASWQRTSDVLTVSVDPGTDFWRETGYGYIRDSGHVYGEVLAGDLDLSVRIRGVLEAQYDQAGVMLRADERTWLKTGIEFFEGRPRLSTVLTLGRSSWMVTDLPDGADDILLRLARRGDAVEVRYLVGDGQAELAALVFMPPDRAVLAGVMCAAPEGPGFRVSFLDLNITERDWSAPAEDAEVWPDEDEAAWAGDEGGSSWAGEEDARGYETPGWAGQEPASGWAGEPDESERRDRAGDAASEDDAGWAGDPVREDHPSWPRDPVREDHPSWPGVAAADPPAKGRLAEPRDAREPARSRELTDSDRQVWAPAPTPGGWSRPADQDAVADWDRLAAGAQAGPQAERWTAQTDDDVANEWPGPPLRATGRAAIGNGSTARDRRPAGDRPSAAEGPPAGEEPSSPAEPEPLPGSSADREPPAGQTDPEPPAGQTDPELEPAASEEPAPAKRRKAAAAPPPPDLPGPPDPADEWISLLTADPADE
jgi:regulation of enolase protein 1 (concanavalin A-like superfamily)